MIFSYLVTNITEIPARMHSYGHVIVVVTATYIRIYTENLDYYF